MNQLNENDIRLLVQMVIHDLEKPMTVNERIFSKILDGTLDPHREPHRRLIRSAGQAASRLTRMLRDLKDVMGGRHPARQSERVPLKRIVDAAAREFVAMAETETVDFTWACPDDAGTSPEADLVQRVIENYLHNALTHTRSGERVWLDVASNGTDGGFLIAVGNRGQTIPDKHLSDIFQPGVQLHLRSENHWRGQGLGLAFCRMAADTLGGRVWAENLPDHGGVVFYLEYNPITEP
jgi:two-component system, sensor histidine kinase and response regulator